VTRAHDPWTGMLGDAIQFIYSLCEPVTGT
jgi:hypothetical protein